MASEVEPGWKEPNTVKLSVIGGGPAGLYFSLLMKKACPDHQVTLCERNRPDDTFGWGVVFSNETLGNLERADPESFTRITEAFAYWDDIDTHFRGRIIRSSGHGFCGLARRQLLQILQQRCVEVGVQMQFSRECEDPRSLADADVVVAADGINSQTRSLFSEHFKPTVVENDAKFIWLGTDKRLEAFTFIIRENQDGLFQVHAYPFDSNTSTFIVETDSESWARAGFDRRTTAESVAYLEELFAPELAGHRLLTNKSMWRNFRTVKCEHWSHENFVLIGDAAHTAHFSIGSGTKIAMEDAICLVDRLTPARSATEIQAALAHYYEDRWLDVAKLQRAARVSRTWFEEIGRYKGFAPEQMVMSLLTRSKRVTYQNLRLRDPDYVGSYDRWFADGHGCGDQEPPPPPMFTPFRVREMALKNRVVVSPMCQYSAEDGEIDDWHLVHLGSRALGGAGLVLTEMTDISRDGRITPGCTGMYKQEHVAAWRRVVDFVHRHSEAKIGIQLAHAGRKAATKVLWEGMDKPLPPEQTENWPILSASAIAWAPENRVPRAMTRADMEAVRDDFVRAVKMSQEAGFDMVELHFAHGYLLSSYISPLSNTRDDAYGGSLENRMRFPLEVFDAARAAWPEGKPMFVRISATDWVPGGVDGDEAVAIGRMLKAHGCDVVDVSAGQTSKRAEPMYGRMFQTPFSDRIRNEAGIPTMAVGNIQGWDHVNTIIASGRADLCALARPHLRDPYLTLHAAIEQDYEGDAVYWPNQYLAGKPPKT